MIGIIGDMHFKESAGYADYISDGRQSEKKAILDKIVESFSDCDSIVLLGDQLNSKNNPSSVIREFVEFLERFENKNLYIMVGNHEKFGDGRSALDFLGELKGKENWHVIAREILNTKIGNRALTFVPYFHNSELGSHNYEETLSYIMKNIEDGDMIFVHHSIGDTSTVHGGKVNLFSEVLLPRQELEKRYKIVFGGHIHQPQQIGRTYVAGSTMAHEVGETNKFIWKISDDLEVEKIQLPGRGIYKVENPTKESLAKIPKESIVKAILTERIDTSTIQEVKKELSKFDSYVLVEQYPTERKKVHFEDGMIEFTPENLLKLYAKEKGVSEEKLIRAFKIIE